MFEYRLKTGTKNGYRLLFINEDGDGKMVLNARLNELSREEFVLDNELNDMSREERTGKLKAIREQIELLRGI